MGARPGERARGGEVARAEFASSARAARARRTGVKVTVLARRAARRASGSAACSASARAPSARRASCGSRTTPRGREGDARARRQGRRVRLRRPVAQDRRRHGDDEDRHVGRGRGDRGDVGAARPRREDARHRLRAARREHAERHRDAPRRRAARCATARRSRCSTPTPRAGSSSPTRSSLASEEKPDAIVDLATLTGACVVALGEKIAGPDGQRRRAGSTQVRAAADRAGERVWPLPLPEEYRKHARLRDRRPTQHRAPAAAAARSPPGCSCRSSSRDAPWAHLDIAGPARAGSRRRLPACAAAPASACARSSSSWSRSRRRRVTMVT